MGGSFTTNERPFIRRGRIWPSLTDGIMCPPGSGPSPQRVDISRFDCKCRKQKRNWKNSRWESFGKVSKTSFVERKPFRPRSMTRGVSMLLKCFNISQTSLPDSENKPVTAFEFRFVSTKNNPGNITQAQVVIVSPHPDAYLMDKVYDFQF